MRTSSLQAAALAYSERGWPVLPLVPREKRPLAKRGLLDASADATQINEWWSRWPNANIGLRTGVAFDVLDIDGEVGLASLSEIAGPGYAHPGPVSRTGRGLHWLFLPNNSMNRANFLPKLDWRGTNGYIVAPPSVHPDGHLYEWVQQGELPPVPEWLKPILIEYREPIPYEDKPIRIIKTNPYSKRNPSEMVIIDYARFSNMKADIVATATELGYAPMPRGPRFVITCPYHAGDNEASLTLYPHNNSFFCFGCGAWGDARNLRDGRPGGKRA